MRGSAQSFRKEEAWEPPEPARETAKSSQRPRCPVCSIPLSDWNPCPTCYKHAGRTGAWYTSEASETLGDSGSKAQRVARKEALHA